MRAVTQREANVRVVQVVGGADAHVVNLLSLAAQFLHMAVEALELGEEVRLREVTINDPNAVVRAKAATRSLPVSLIAFMWRGAM